MKPVELSVVFPCLNEVETLQQSINEAKHHLEKHGIKYELIVSDNGSTDGSQDLASSLGARVVNVPARGYGNALRGGIDASLGEYVIFLDADCSYSLENLESFVALLRGGYDLVMGNRFLGGIEPGAMPALHKYLGNPVLSWLGRRLFPANVGDFHCGIRGLRKSAIQSLNLNSEGMEFASEVVVKSIIGNLKVTETPVKLYRDKRSRAPHLKSFPDGWRHLRFLLAFAPKSLFLGPGVALTLFGLLVMIPILLYGNLRMNNLIFGANSLLFSSISICIGASFLSCYGLVREFANSLGVRLDQNKEKKSISNSKSVSDRYIFSGIFIMTIGLLLGASIVVMWVKKSFEITNSLDLLRLTVPSMTMILVGSQLTVSGLISVIFNAFSAKRQ